MAEFPALPMWTDAILADCGYMSDQEFGAYHRLLYLIWRSPHCKIPNDNAWLSKRLQRPMEVIESIYRPFITTDGEDVAEVLCRTDGNWIYQKRLLKEKEYLTKQSKKQSDTAKSRWKKEKQQSRGNATSGNAPTPTPTTHKDITKVISTEVAVPDTFAMSDGTFLSFDGLFDRLWNLYPNIRDRGHKGEAKTIFKKKLKEGTNYESIGRGVAKYRRYCDATGEKQPDFKRWLAANGWERDFNIPAEGAGTGKPAGNYLQTIHDQALRDTTSNPAGSEERLARLGLDDIQG